MNVARQSMALSGLAVRSLATRLWPSLSTVAAVAIVTLVLLGFLSMSEGFRRTVEGAGAEDVAILLRKGSNAELTSSIPQSQVQMLENAGGIARAPGGGKWISGELYAAVQTEPQGGGEPQNLTIRGVGRNAAGLRPNLRLTAGRMPSPGVAEILVGRGVAEDLAGWKVGDSVEVGGNRWRVVGLFEAAGNVVESEIWADLAVVQSVFGRGNVVQSVRVKTEGPGAMERISRFLEADPQLDLQARSEREFYAEQAGGTSSLILYLAWPLGIAMSIGALAAMLNTMFTSVAQREAEIMTLRAIGFSSRAVLISVVAEALALSAIGVALGTAIARLFLDGMAASTMGQNLTRIAFGLELSWPLVLQAGGLAVAIGLVGGLIPGLRAARRPLVR